MTQKKEWGGSFVFFFSSKNNKIKNDKRRRKEVRGSTCLPISHVAPPLNEKIFRRNSSFHVCVNDEFYIIKEWRSILSAKCTSEGTKKSIASKRVETQFFLINNKKYISQITSTNQSKYNFHFLYEKENFLHLKMGYQTCRYPAWIHILLQAGTQQK